MAKLEQRLGEARAKVSVVRLKISPEGASVSVDGEPVGVSPLADALVLDPGQHEVVATLDGYTTSQTQLDAAAGTKETLSITLAALAKVDQPEPTGGPGGAYLPVVIGGAVVSVAALGAGAAMHVVASGKGSERDDLVAGLAGDSSSCTGSSPSPDCATITTLTDDQNSFATIGTALLVTGGVFAVGTLVAVMVWPDQDSGADRDAPESASIWMAPTSLPDHAGSIDAGFMVGGSF